MRHAGYELYDCMTCGLGGKGREDLIRFSADMFFLGLDLGLGLAAFFKKGWGEDVDLMSQEYIVFAFLGCSEYVFEFIPYRFD